MIIVQQPGVVGTTITGSQIVAINDNEAIVQTFPALGFTQPGSVANYEKYLYGEAVKTDRLNEPVLLDFAFVPVDTSFVKLKRGAYVVFRSSLYGAWFTGYITNEPELDYLGTQNSVPAWGYKYQATSDEYLLNQKNLGILPPFINTTQGAVLTFLVNKLAPGIFDTSSIQVGNNVARYVVDPNKKFSDVVKEFADSAAYVFRAQSKAITFAPQDSVDSTLTIDGNNTKYFTPANLSFRQSDTQPYNDVVVVGDIEAQNYMNEYFIGDGYTAKFPLISSVFGVAKSVIVDDFFESNVIDTSKWIEVDPIQNYIQTSNGFLNVLGGNAGGSFDAYLTSQNLVPLEGKLRLTHGEFDFIDSASTGVNGVIGGLWTQAPNSSYTGCVFGFRVNKASGVTSLNPIVNGTVDGSHSLAISFSHRYIIRTICSSAHYRRSQNNYSYLGVNGAVGTLNGGLVATVLSFATIISEVDPTTGTLLNITKWNHGSTTLAPSTLFANYCPVASNDLHCTVTGITISVPMQVSVEKAPQGSSTYSHLLVGQNDVDAMDGTVPDCTVSDAGGSSDKNSTLGTIDYNPGNAALEFFKDSTKQTTTVPAVGEKIHVSYRRAANSIARIQDKAAIAIEAASWGDDGVRSITRKDIVPPPATSGECEIAAGALIKNDGYQHFEGTYKQNSGYEFTGEPKSGSILKFVNLPGAFPSSLQAEVVLEVKSTFLSTKPQEVFEHEISFGKMDYVRKALVQFSKPSDNSSIDAGIQMPNFIDITAIGNTTVPDVFAPTLSTVGTNNILIVTNQAPATGGGFEARYTDDSWGADDGKNLVIDATSGFNGRTTSQNIYVPRNARGKVVFIKGYDTRNKFLYSEDLTQGAWTKGTGTTVANSSQIDPDGNISQISTVTLGGTLGTRHIYQESAITSSPSTSAFTVSLKGTVGDVITLGIYSAPLDDSPITSVDVTMTGKWQRATVTATIPGGVIGATHITGRISHQSGVTSLQVTRASLEIGTTFETVYCKTNGTPYGVNSRFASCVRVQFPLVPPAPTATIDYINDGKLTAPVVSIQLPASLQDVWGVEIKASDNTTVLFQKDLTDTSLAPTYTLPANASRNVSLYVYTYNLLGELSTAYNLVATLPSPSVSGITINDATRTISWTGVGATKYIVSISDDAGFTASPHTVTVASNSYVVPEDDFYNLRYFWITPVDDIGNGTQVSYGSHFYIALQAAHNLITNPNFEGGNLTFPGFIIHNATASYVSGGAQYAGLRALQVNSTAQYGGLYSQAAYRIPLRVGESMRLGGRAKSASGSYAATIALAFYDASSVFISEITASTTSTSWAAVEVVGKVPTDTAYGVVEFRCDSATTGTAYFDETYLYRVYDPSTLDISKLGSMSPSWSGSFSYTSTDTSITWSWTSMTIYRSDGTVTSVSNSSLAITGLTASTTYYFYPYYDEISGVLTFVTTGGIGSPTAAYTARSSTVAQEQGNQAHVPLSSGAISAATAAGGGTGGGGGLGGDGSCLRINSLVLTKDRGVQPLGTCREGDWIMGRTDWTQITWMKVLPCSEFINLKIDAAHEIESSPTHKFTVPTEEDEIPKAAMDMSISQPMYTKRGIDFLKSIYLVEESDFKVAITCLPEHEFWAGKYEPNILTHNIHMLS